MHHGSCTVQMRELRRGLANFVATAQVKRVLKASIDVM
jgi:hypothetical protein